MSDFEILENTDKEKEEFAKRGWGNSEAVITKEAIQALLEGKALGYDDGEYTHFITLKTDDTKGK